MECANQQIAATDPIFADDDPKIIVRRASSLGDLVSCGRIELLSHDVIEVNSQYISRHLTMMVASDAARSRTTACSVSSREITMLFEIIDTLVETAMFDGIEIEFTFEKFRIVVSHPSSGATMCAIHTGSSTAVVTDLHKLQELRALFSRAQSLTDNHMATQYTGAELQHQ
jgi:hypothetical protein